VLAEVLTPVPVWLSVVVVAVPVVPAVPEGLLLTPPGVLALGGVLGVWVAVPATPPVVLGELLEDGGIEVEGVCCASGLDGIGELGGAFCVPAAPAVLVWLPAEALEGEGISVVVAGAEVCPLAPVEALALPEMLPDLFSVPLLGVLALEGELLPLLELVPLATFKWSLTFSLPAYCSAIFLAASFSFLEPTFPVNSTSLSVTLTVMLSLLRLGSFFNAFWICD